MQAELIAVGSELLRFGRRDTNADWLSEQLGRIGCETVVRSMVDDDERRIAALVRAAWERAELVLLTGGLGPTEDDRTRQALALALDLPLEMDVIHRERLRRGLEARGYRFTDEQARQALRPRGTRWIENPVGSAFGVLVEREDRLLAALPGVPAEMKSMFRATLVPLMTGRGARRIVRRTLHVAGRLESSVDRQLRDLYATPGLDATILSGVDGLQLKLQAEVDPRSGADPLDEVEARIRERLGEDVYGADDETLPEVVGGLLRRAGRCLATAESCTAGLLSAAITRVAGSSAWYRGGLVVYDDRLKIRLAGVSEESLRQHGAVSPVVACELAAGARRACMADFGIGITGIAGPGGGTADKPVGLVQIALHDGHACEQWAVRFPGIREDVRRRSVTYALDRLRRRLLASKETSE